MLKSVNINGRVAQLGERGVRNAEVEGSIPFSSTKPFTKMADSYQNNISLDLKDDSSSF